MIAHDPGQWVDCRACNAGAPREEHPQLATTADLPAPPDTPNPATVEQRLIPVRGHPADLHPSAESLGAFRVIGEEGRVYRSQWAGPKWIAALFRQACATGLVRAAADHGDYAVLDVFDKDGSIVQDFVIPTPRAFRWWYRKLELRVESSDGR